MFNIARKEMKSISTRIRSYELLRTCIIIPELIAFYLLDNIFILSKYEYGVKKKTFVGVKAVQ
jgi:hypothetical protein